MIFGHTALQDNFIMLQLFTREKKRKKRKNKHTKHFTLPKTHTVLMFDKKIKTVSCLYFLVCLFSMLDSGIQKCLIFPSDADLVYFFRLSVCFVFISYSIKFVVIKKKTMIIWMCSCIRCPSAYVCMTSESQRRVLFFGRVCVLGCLCH